MPPSRAPPPSLVSGQVDRQHRFAAAIAEDRWMCRHGRHVERKHDDVDNAPGCFIGEGPKARSREASNLRPVSPDGSPRTIRESRERPRPPAGCCSRSEPVRSLIFARTSSSEDARMEPLRDRCHIPPGARSAIEGILSQGGFSARRWG